MESNNLVENVITGQIQRDILMSIKGLCMKKSSTLAEIVVIFQLQRDILLSIKVLCMCIIEVVFIVEVVFKVTVETRERRTGDMEHTKWE